MDVLEKEIKVEFGDVDASGGITPFALFDFFQKIAEEHAEIIGVGRDFMEQNKQVWVLSRMTVFVQERPRLDGRFFLRTFPRGFDKLFCLRDFDIKDKTGKTCARGRSAWLVLDGAKRRPLRPESITVPIPKNESINIFADIAGRLPLALDAPKDAALFCVRRALYSDIDYNAHMNNARYIEWLQDAASCQILLNAESFRIDINYLSEVKMNDDVELFKSEEDGNGFLLEGRKGGAAAFRAKLLFL